MNGLRCMFGCALLVSMAAGAAPQVDVVARGLSNPRGLAFAPDGALYVAEAGKGGNGGCAVLGDGQTGCYGETGAVLRIDLTGKKEPARVLRNLPSLAPEGGFGATGPQAVAFGANGAGRVALGLGSHRATREGLGRYSWLFGRVIPVSKLHGTAVPPATDKQPAQLGDVPPPTAAQEEKAPIDLAAFEDVNDPAGDGSDSNPEGLLTQGANYIAVDAGGNSLLRIGSDKKITTLATFAPRDVPAPPFLGLPPGATIPMQAVPTSVAEGQDGALYVGQLTGFPFPAGAANVWRVPAEGGEPEVFASGFTNIIGVAFDAAGRLHVLQIGAGFAGPGGPPLLAPGRLIRVEADGTRTVIYENLYYPGGLAIGPDGAAYVTNNGIVPGPIPGAFPDGGQVLRISLD
ncbi:ScyD/ScyE family protein [Massilia dura]|uniref:ScyD/ScyE family protein n=1 Tax=Pseudoduganella dura TaxID=321982 RepID=A0A6I3XJW7_9BURK|nr:ScyD/ScyE family protein [Pseudoduganella dura]MUI13492.1 ScyD/ScyE family protein [Pseudoduganella dura]GGX73239.1 hypothetical protein GCM10007386_00010 [Pseudoduganella dura]